MKITDKLDGAHCCHCRHLKRVVGKKYKERLLEDAMTPRELSPGMEARIERNLKQTLRFVGWRILYDCGPRPSRYTGLTNNGIT